MEFRTADEATFALNEMHGHPFDTKHTFRVNRFTDIEKFANLDETYHEPQRESYKAKVSVLCDFIDFSEINKTGCGRNIFVLGWRTHKDVISMSPIAAMRLRSIGMESRLRARSHIQRRSVIISYSQIGGVAL